MECPAFFRTAFPLIVIPSVCWLLGLAAIRPMGKNAKNLYSGLSALVTILLMIALTLFRAFVRSTALRLSGNALWPVLTLTLLFGVGIFLRAWGLYGRETLASAEIAPYCKAGFLILSGAALSALIAYLGAA